MPEYLADNLKWHTDLCHVTTSRSPEIVKVDVLQIGSFADPFPRLLEITSWLGRVWWRGEHIRGLGHPWETTKNGNRRGREESYLRSTRFRLRNPDLCPIEVNVCPGSGEQLSLSKPGQNEQRDGGSNVGILCLLDCRHQPCHLQRFRSVAILATGGSAISTVFLVSFGIHAILARARKGEKISDLRLVKTKPLSLV